MNLLYSVRLLIHNFVCLLKLFLKVRICLKGEKLNVSNTKRTVSLSVDINSGEIKVLSSSDISFNGRYVFIQCDSERVEAIQEGLHKQEAPVR